jgi:Sperm-tail PG-rich repeat
MNKRHKSISANIDKNRKSNSVNLTIRGFSFGAGQRSDGLSLRGRDSPSPHKYNPVVVESPYKGVKLKGYSSDLNIVKRLQNLPGPGSYNPYEPLGANVPKITIKPRLEYYTKPSTPAPNAYFPEYNNFLKSSPNYSIPSAIRSKDIKNKQEVNPGPGAYNLPKIL